MPFPSALRVNLRRKILLRCFQLLPWPILFCAPVHREENKLDAPLWVRSAWITDTRSYDAPCLFHDLCPGDRVELRATTSSGIHRATVEIYHNCGKLGVLPQPCCQSIIALLQRHVELRAKIIEVSGDKDHPLIRVGIWLRDDGKKSSTERQRVPKACHQVLVNGRSLITGCFSVRSPASSRFYAPFSLRSRPAPL